MRLWNCRSFHSLLVGMQTGWRWLSLCITTHLQAALWYCRTHLVQCTCFHQGCFNGFCPQVSFSLQLILLIANDWRSVILKYKTQSIFSILFLRKYQLFDMLFKALHYLPQTTFHWLSPFLLLPVWTKSLPKLPFLVWVFLVLCSSSGMLSPYHHLKSYLYLKTLLNHYFPLWSFLWTPQLAETSLFHSFIIIVFLPLKTLLICYLVLQLIVGCLIISMIALFLKGMDYVKIVSVSFITNM